MLSLCIRPCASLCLMPNHYDPVELAMAEPTAIIPHATIGVRECILESKWQATIALNHTLDLHPGCKGHLTAALVQLEAALKLASS